MADHREPQCLTPSPTVPGYDQPDKQIAGQLAAHPDAHIFTSLPRAGTLRAARLLAELP